MLLKQPTELSNIPGIFAKQRMYCYGELVYGHNHEILEELPRGRAYLVDQLQRAASSIALNIAEGAGEYARHEKHRFYRMAKRSATECAAILDIGLKLGLIETEKLRDARNLLFRVVSMLIKMVNSAS